jgi:hypothetical protein
MNSAMELQETAAQVLVRIPHMTREIAAHVENM